MKLKADFAVANDSIKQLFLELQSLINSQLSLKMIIYY
jgi:hypothetical protein